MDVIEPEQKPQETLEFLKLNIEFELKTGVVRVSGHIDNTDLCLKILCEAGHVILVKNAEKNKAIIEQQQKLLDAVKVNGHNEDAPPAAVN